MAKEICEDCGSVFKAGPDAFLCLKCRKRRASESAKRRNLSQLGIKARKEKKMASVIS